MILTLYSIAASAMPTNRVTARVGLSSYIPACRVGGAPPHHAAGRASALLTTDSTPNRRWPQIADIGTYERPADISANGPDQASEQVIEGECQTQARQPQRRSELDRLQAHACLRSCRNRLLMG